MPKFLANSATTLILRTVLTAGLDSLAGAWYASTMFWWRKKKKAAQAAAVAKPDGSASPRATPAYPTDSWDPGGTIQFLSALDVVDNFLSQNPKPTPFSVHALIKAGAAELMLTDELLQACDKIQEHGYQYPLNPTLQRELHEEELLGFLRWQATSHVEYEAYQNENTIRHLIDRFRHETIR